MSNRRRAREMALRAAYALELSGNSVEQTLQDIILNHDHLSETVKNFASELFQLAHKHGHQIDDFIKQKALNWDFSRIAILDKLILRLAICEFLYFEDIPPKVSIDEAIEISKKYSTEKSGKFINGILDSVLFDLREQGILAKKGRGLIE